MKKPVQQMGGGWIFLAVTIVICVAASLFGFVETRSILVIFFGFLQKILPILAGVFFLMFLFNLFLDPERIVKYLSKDSGLKGWFLAIGAGVISMGSTYFWYPLLADLKIKGMANSLMAVFLYNHAVKIQLFPFLIHYFGLLFTVIVTVYMIIFSVVGGWLMEKFVPSLEQ